jgi:hypothetical protein
MFVPLKQLSKAYPRRHSHDLYTPHQKFRFKFTGRKTVNDFNSLNGCGECIKPYIHPELTQTDAKRVFTSQGTPATPSFCRRPTKPCGHPALLSK